MADFARNRVAVTVMAVHVINTLQHVILAVQMAGTMIHAMCLVILDVQRVYAIATQQNA